MFLNIKEKRTKKNKRKRYKKIAVEPRPSKENNKPMKKEIIRKCWMFRKN